MVRILENKLGVNDIFEGLNPEWNPGEQRKVVVEGYNESVVDELCKRFISAGKNDYSIFREYQEAVLSLDISCNDVEEFSLRLPLKKTDVNYRFFEPGLFISSCILSSSDNEFRIHTNHLDYALKFVGYYGNHGKKIIVEGDVGSHAGGGMVDGLLEINGNAGPALGWGMRGGKVVLNGEPSDSVGLHILGGEIHINGPCESSVLFGFNGKLGQIFCNGTKVWGRTLEDLDEYFRI